MQQQQILLDFRLKLPEVVNYEQIKQSQKWKPEYFNDPELYKIMIQLKKKLETVFKKWKIEQNFSFELPESKFESASDKPLISYNAPNQLNDQLQVRELSQQQIKSIKQDGTFFVNSSYYSIPYKWKLNEWIYKGTINIMITLKKDLAKVYNQFYQIGERISSDFISLKKGIIRLYKFLPNMINLLLGLKKTQEVHQNYTKIAQMERNKQIFNTLWNDVKKQFYQFINIPVNFQKDTTKSIANNQLINKRANQVNIFINDFSTLDNQLNSYWIQNKDKQYEQLSIKYQGNALAEKIAQKKYQLLEEYIRNKFGQKNKLACNVFIEDYRQIRIIFNQQLELGKQIQQARKRFNLQIDQKFPIRRYSKKWRAKKQEQFMKIQQKNLKAKKLEKIKNLISNKIFNHYIDFLATYEQRIEKIKLEHPPKSQPSRIFRCPYKLFPPYKIQRNYYNGHDSYQLIRQQNKYIQTTYFCWRIVLNFMRWITWSINIMYWLFRGVWGGRLGIKVLFCRDTFYPKYIVNQRTGILSRDYSFSWDPIIRSIQLTYQGIKQSRNQFQNAPDNGFFGKSCARVFNIIQNYVFRLIIVLFLYLMIIKPIVIIINVVLCTFLAVTAILWTPIIIILYYLINILIYNFDFDERYPYARYSERIFPLFCISAKFIYDLLYTLISLLGILYHPIFAILVFIFSIFRYVFRNIYDFFMLGVVKCFGRSPVRDTSMAWKVSGPGLSRQYYQSLKQSDVYILVMAELQNIHLRKYHHEVQKVIRGIKTEMQQKLNKVFLPFNVTYQDFRQIDESTQHYIYTLNMQIEKRKRKFPLNPGNQIRFSDEQLKKYLHKSNQITRFFVKQNHANYMFSEFSLKEGDFQALTQKIWINIFNNQEVLQPFEQLDERFELLNNRQDQLVKGVMAAIQGQVDLANDKVPYLKYGKQRKPTQKTIFQVYQMGLLYQGYQGSQFYESKNSWLYSILFNYNIKAYIQDQRKNSNDTDRQNHTDINMKKSNLLVEQL